MNNKPILFRASSLGKLFTKKEWESGKLAPLGDTAIAHLCEVAARYHGRTVDVSTKQMAKGTEVEDQSIDLYNRVHLTLHEKNERWYANDHVCGTPDIIAPDKVVDIKSSWSLDTFYKSKMKSDNLLYVIQLHVYCWLTGRDKAELAYCVINTPKAILDKELSYLSYRSEGEPSDEAVKQMITNHTFDDLPDEHKLHIKRIDIDPSKYELIAAKVEQCREILKQII